MTNKPGKERTILVVDDLFLTRKQMGSVFAKHNLNVLEADNGITALKQLKEHSEIALMITDLYMPKMDGMPLCRAIRADPQWKHLPIIFMSGEDSKIHIKTAAELGIKTWLKKPVDLVQLSDLLDRFFKAMEFNRQKVTSKSSTANGVL
jgi:two-component system chemotaxis response regulator CheY